MKVKEFYEKWCSSTNTPMSHWLKNDCVQSDSRGWSVYYYGSLIAGWEPDTGLQLYREHFSMSTTRRHNMLKTLRKEDQDGGDR